MSWPICLYDTNHRSNVDTIFWVLFRVESVGLDKIYLKRYLFVGSFNNDHLQSWDLLKKYISCDRAFDWHFMNVNSKTSRKIFYHLAKMASFEKIKWDEKYKAIKNILKVWFSYKVHLSFLLLEFQSYITDGFPSYIYSQLTNEEEIKSR